MGQQPCTIRSIKIVQAWKYISDFTCKQLPCLSTVLYWTACSKIGRGFRSLMLHLMLAEELLLDLRLASEKRNLEGVRQNRGRNRTVSKSPLLIHLVRVFRWKLASKWMMSPVLTTAIHLRSYGSPPRAWGKCWHREACFNRWNTVKLYMSWNRPTSSRTVSRNSALQTTKCKPIYIYTCTYVIQMHVNAEVWWWKNIFLVFFIAIRKASLAWCVSNTSPAE